MNRTRIFLLSCAAVVLAVVNSYGQNFQNDFGTWVNLQATKSWEKPYAFLRAEHRSAKNATTTEAFFISAGGGYRFTKWLNADLSYEFWDVPPLDRLGANTLYHKVVVALTGTLRRDGLALMLREKYELSISNETGNLANVLRSRLRGQYSIGDGTFTPYLMYEFFAGLEGQGWVRSLHYVGCEIRLSNCLVFDIFYNYHLFDGGPYLDNGSRHILGAGLNFNF